MQGIDEADVLEEFSVLSTGQIQGKTNNQIPAAESSSICCLGLRLHDLEEKISQGTAYMRDSMIEVSDFENSPRVMFGRLLKSSRPIGLDNSSTSAQELGTGRVCV
jgi:hypothetical protein